MFILDIVCESPRENMSQKQLNEKVKREVLSEQLDAFLMDNNLLVVKLGRKVKLVISNADKSNLLDRIMKEPSYHDIVDTTNKLVTSIADIHKHDLCPLEHEMKLSREIPVIEITFKTFDYPYSDEWAHFYDEYNFYLLLGTNADYLQAALQNRLPLEISVSKYSNSIIRFNVHQPYPKNKIGVAMYTA